MLSFEEIAGEWETLNKDLFTMPYTREDYPGLGEEAVQFMNDWGFPEDAAPELDFTDLLAGRLYTHSQLYTREDFPLLNDYLVIGATGSGNPICIDTANQEVIITDHDNGFERILVNTSLPLFSYALSICQALYPYSGTPDIDLINDINTRLTEADPRCTGAGTFWHQEISKVKHPDW